MSWVINYIKKIDNFCDVAMGLDYVNEQKSGVLENIIYDIEILREDIFEDSDYGSNVLS